MKEYYWYCKITKYNLHSGDCLCHGNLKILKTTINNIFKIDLPYGITKTEFCEKYEAKELTFNTIESLISWLDNIDWRSL